MKKICLVLLLLTTTLLAPAQSYELSPNGKDTINLIDANGKKQGKWIIRGKHRTGTCYQPDQKVEEGKYTENRKTGAWIEYYCNGNMKNKLTFNNGRPDGYAIMYHENGKVSEEGIWRNNRWVGAYKLYYENGQVQHEFVYNQNGKREGNQKYYYENGQLAIEGNFANGKEAGLIREYHENGDLKAERIFNDGQVDVASIKTYEPKKPNVKITDTPDNAPKVTLAKDERPNEAMAAKGPIVLNGDHTLYNRNKQITKDGFFKDNRLMDGKAYIYDENGILQRIAVYKNGIYAGDAPIEN